MDRKQIELYDLIEKINLENILLREKIKKNKINKIKNFIRDPLNTIIIKSSMRKITFHYNHDNDFSVYNIELLKNKIPRIAVYTCITGNYDSVCDPFIKFDNIDFYLFTNNDKIKSKIWMVKKIDKNIEKKYDNIKLNRYYKFHPFDFFSPNDYDYVIYIDGNIQVVSNLTTLTYVVSDKTGLALHNHCMRKDVYEEAKACCIFKKGNQKKIRNQINRYKKEKFPNDFGLFECNVIVSDLKNKAAQKIFDFWWNDFIVSESNRDQLSFPYTLWKLKYCKDDIGILGKNVYHNPKLRFNNHN